MYLKNYFAKGNLFTRLLASYFLFLIIPFTLLSTLYFRNVSNTIYDKLSDIQVKKLESDGAETNGIEKSAQTIYSSLMFNSSVLTLFSGDACPPINSSRFTELVDNIVFLENTYRVTYNYIQSIYVYSSHNGTVIDSIICACSAEDFYDADFLLNTPDAPQSAIFPTRYISPDRAVDASIPTRSKIVSFVYPIIHQGAGNGIIVINVYENAFNQALSTSPSDVDSLLIFSSDGTVISNATSLSSDDAQELISRIRSSDKQDGLLEMPENRVAAFYKSSSGSLNYIAVYPADNVFYDIRKLNITVILIISACLIIGTAVSLWFSSNFYNPIKTATNRLTALLENGAEGKGNELTILNTAISNVLKNRQQLEKDLLKAKVPLEQMSLLSFWAGRPSSGVPEMDFSFIPDSYCVAMLVLDRYSSIRINYQHIDLYYFKTVLLEIISHMTSGHGKMVSRGAIFGEKMIAVLFCAVDIEGRKLESNIAEILRGANDEISRINGLSFSSGVGSIVDGLEDTRTSYSEAIEATNFTLCYGQKSLIYFDETSAGNAETMPLLSEEKLYNFLEIGDVGKVQMLLNEYCCSLQDFKYLENDSVLAALFDIVNMLQRFAKIHGVNFVSFSEDATSPYTLLSKCDSIDEMFALLYGFVEKIAENYLQISQTYLISAQDIESFIESNYSDSNMNIVMMVEKLGISYSYARQLFKEYFDSTFVNYLNTRRIQEAKILMCREDLSIKAVAVNIGYNNDQSFTRFFKKFEGITPGEYRRRILMLKGR